MECGLDGPLADESVVRLGAGKVVTHWCHCLCEESAEVGPVVANGVTFDADDSLACDVSAWSS